MIFSKRNSKKWQEIFEWCKECYRVKPDYPWNDWNAVLRHQNNKKWFGLVLEVEADKIGMDGDRMIDLLNVKCDPALIGSLLLKDGFFPAYHMSKDNWVSILLDDRVNDEIIKDHMSGCFPLSVWYFRQSTDFWGGAGCQARKCRTQKRGAGVCVYRCLLFQDIYIMRGKDSDLRHFIAGFCLIFCETPFFFAISPPKTHFQNFVCKKGGILSSCIIQT